jgi:hypothetical protein
LKRQASNTEELLIILQFELLHEHSLLLHEHSFLLYINDLHNAIIYSDIYLFADDTHILHINKSLDSLNKKLNVDLKLLCNWLNANKIALNSNKTELVLFKHRSRKLSYNLKLKLNGRRMYPSQSIKYLGVIIDENLNWCHHVNSLSTKFRRANGALSKLRHYVPQPILVSVYHAIFSSHMRYACQVWGQNQSTITRRILLLQKSAIWIMSYASFRSPSKPLFFQLRILNIFDLVKLLNMLFIHQSLNFEVPPHIL